MLNLMTFCSLIITRSVKIAMCLLKQDKMNISYQCADEIESIEFLPQFTLTTQDKIISD